MSRKSIEARDRLPLESRLQLQRNAIEALRGDGAILAASAMMFEEYIAEDAAVPDADEVDSGD